MSSVTSANFTVHFLDKWLYPVDTTTTAYAFLQTALSNPSSAVVSQNCNMCSYIFANLWYNVMQTSTYAFVTWAQSTVGSQTSGMTMFIPYTQTLSSVYSINSLASMIQSMITSNSISNITALSQVSQLYQPQFRLFDVSLDKSSVLMSNNRQISKFIQNNTIISAKSRSLFSPKVSANSSLQVLFLSFKIAPRKSGLELLI